MERKLVRQGRNALTVTLPAKWTNQRDLKAGDVVQITEVRNILLVSSEKEVTEKIIMVNTKGMEHTALFKEIVVCYEIGYSEIHIIADKTRFIHPGMDEDRIKSIDEELARLTNRLVGLELVSSHSGLFILKDIAKTSPSEFDSVLRRIFYLILEFQDEVKRKIIGKETIKNSTELRDNIVKFISFCTRLLNLNIDKSDIEKNNLHTVLSFLKKITDAIRWLSRDYNLTKKKMPKDIKLITNLMDYFRNQHSLFYKFDVKLVNKAAIDRVDLRKRLRKCKDPKVVSFSSIIEYARTLTELKLGLIKSANLE